MIGIFYTVYAYNTSNFGGFAVILGYCLIKGEIMKEQFFVYVGWSLLKGEQDCLTIGISKNIDRRSYNKIMSIDQVLPAQSKRHALAIERSGHLLLDEKFPRAFVKWNPIGLEKSPNRGWDWWITNRPITTQIRYEIVERMRFIQLTWKVKNAKLYMAKIRRSKNV